MGRSKTWAALLLLGLAATGSGLQGQQVEYPDEPAVDRAEQLEAEAQAQLADLDRWDSAADRLRDAARLRPRGDAVAIEDLMLAGKLSFYTGSALRALRDLGHAGERALQEGFVELAARAFADAAWVAREGGQPDAARNFGERAQLLSHSPVIDDDLRRELRQRFAEGT